MNCINSIALALLVLVNSLFGLVTANEITNDNSSQGKSSELSDMSLQDLLKQRASLHSDSDTASGTQESLRNAPAAMVVIDALDIRRRGYDSLDDILKDLPGFDTIVTNGTMQVIAYQRGYRTPWTQRTLLLINGKVDNNLWNHAAQLSRQYPINIIDRVEVLYGPAGAVYGPNAFLGVINVITKDGANLADGESFTTASLQAGSFNSKSVDIASGGRAGQFNYMLGAKLFSSDEPHISNYSNWGFTNEAWLRDPTIWGAGIGDGIDPATSNASPVGDVNVNGSVEPFEEFNGKPLGKYADPSDNMGFFSEIGYGNFNVGILHWQTDEAYGPYYSFADAQPNVAWQHESTQFYMEHSKQKTAKLKVTNEAVFRISRAGGDWIESFGDFVSISQWNSYNSAWRVEQKYNYKMNSLFTLNGAVKYEHKNLSKTYIICNYFDGGGVCPAQAANSSNGITSDGSGVLEADQISSTNPLSMPPNVIEDDIPTYNLSKTTDVGAFLQGILNFRQWRLNAGARVDNNSIYGSEINPRGAAIFHYNPNATFKLVYGEAFQEPSPKDLYGGWNGRNANPDLKPEKVRNIEFISIYQTKYLLHDASIFYANYTNAIAGGENVGGRDIYGFEYRGSYRIPNFIPGSADITGNLFYTFTKAYADQQYNNVTGIWVDNKAEQGDIAPHKINLMINFPVKNHWNLNIAANWLAARNLFSENPLRAESNSNRTENRKAESYSKFDANVVYNSKRFTAGFKIENIFEAVYLLPGVESASSGDDFSADADGFQNSLLPQVKERVYSFNFKIKI